jgi:hypothetical protein
MNYEANYHSIVFNRWMAYSQLSAYPYDMARITNEDSIVFNIDDIQGLITISTIH